MNKLGGSGIFVTAIALVVFGLFLRWELIDWLIDAMGFLFIAAGLALVAFGIFNWATSRKGGSSAY
jgi:hypothetical protein